MRSFWLLALTVGLPALLPPDTLPPNYEQTILRQRQERAKGIDSPASWLSLVALQPLTAGDVSVGSAPGNTLRLEHGLPHAFTLHVEPGKVTLKQVDPAVTVDGKPLHPGDPVSISDDDKATLHWNDLSANAIARTGNQVYLRVRDPESPNRRHFHGLNFYPVNPAFRIIAQWTPYTTPHEIHMGTVLGTVLTLPSPGFATFTVNGQAVRLEATGGGRAMEFSFRDGTYKTTTYGAGRQVATDLPSNGLKSPGTVIIDFNEAINWPCAYTEYGTCPLPPPQNRFDALIPAGEKRYHD